MNHYLLIFERSSGQLVITPFVGPDAGRRALRARFAAEVQYEGQEDVEVVVIQAANQDAIRRTHSRYFESASELAAATKSELLAR